MEGATEEKVSQTVTIQPHYPNPKQAKYLLACANPTWDTVLYGGGAGAGKTVGQATAILDFSTRLPGNCIAVVRKTKKDLADTIQRDFFEFTHPALILEHNKGDQVTKIRTAEKDHPTEIHWRGLDDLSRWGGRHFGQIFVEEASEINSREYLYLFTRLRHKLPKELTYAKSNPYLVDDPEEPGGFSVRRFISLCYNPPEDPTHWLYTLQREGTVDGRKQRVCYIHTTTMDNYENLDRTYKNILENLPELDYARLVLGQDSTGVKGNPVAYMFRKEENLFKSEDIKHVQTWYTGHDLGWVLPNKVWGEYTDGTLYIHDLLVKRKMDLRQFLKDECPIVEQKFNPDAKYVDFVDHQHAVQHNDKDRKTSEQIMRTECGRNPQHSFSRPEWRGELINELFRTKRLWIADHLQTLINCLTYGWVKDEKGEMVKDGYWEHIADSLGYLVWGLFKGKAQAEMRGKRGQRVENRTKHIKEQLETAKRLNNFNLGRR